MHPNYGRFIGLLVIFSFIFYNVAYAQLGEVAGPLNFNVSVGSSASLQYTLINGGSQPIHYQIVLPSLNIVPNSTAPTFTVSQMNGTISPQSQLVINVTAYMPSNDKPGMHWGGILQAVEVSNITISGSGAVIHQGVAKLVGVTAAQPKGIPLLYIVLAIVVLIIIIVLVYYFMRRRKHTGQHPKSRRRKSRKP
jgi:hypothetical protein